MLTFGPKENIVTCIIFSINYYKISTKPKII